MIKALHIFLATSLPSFGWNRDVCLDPDSVTKTPSSYHMIRTRPLPWYEHDRNIPCFTSVFVWFYLNPILSIDATIGWVLHAATSFAGWWFALLVCVLDSLIKMLWPCQMRSTFHVSGRNCTQKSVVKLYVFAKYTKLMDHFATGF